MPRLVATTAFHYAGRDLAVGAEFDASESDAFILKNVDKAKDAEARNTAPADATAAAEPAAERSEPNNELFGGEQSARRGRHNRRDMRAKD